MKKKHHKHPGQQDILANFRYRAEPVADAEGLCDIAISPTPGHEADGLPEALWGRDGRQRELDFAAAVPADALPVLVGAGLGVALEALLARGLPVAVLDLEEPVLAATGLRARHAEDPRVSFFQAQTPPRVMQLLTRWQMEQGLKPLHPICFPFYSRINRPFYSEIVRSLRQTLRHDLQRELRYPKFTSAKPKVLLIRSGYFLEQEIASALDSLGVQHLPVVSDMKDKGDTRFVERLLDGVLSFKPDFVLTVNHLGLDREGVLQNLLAKLDIPLASWFVDNPYLILYLYGQLTGGRTAIFSYDADALPQLKALGFENAFYLPLAASLKHFRPCAEEQMDLSFVGNSMLAPVARLCDRSYLPPRLIKSHQRVAGEFAAGPERTAAETLSRCCPDLRQLFDALATTEHRLTYEQLVVFEATRQYRHHCVARLAPFSPVVFGDEGWREALGKAQGYTIRPEVDYYRDLPTIYSASRINFNNTSLQMKGAVNQRVFDVPACGRFLLTDARPQMDALFEPGVECVAYASPEEIPALAERYLKDAPARRAVAEAARKRVHAEHSYEHRLKSLLATMRQTFA